VQITILTLFPEFFSEIFKSSIIGKAVSSGLVTINAVNFRKFATDKHKSVDDRPYGGGKGMILRVDILEKAINSVRINSSKKQFTEKVILLDPAGMKYTQETAKSYTKIDHIILICGHYEGFDFRINNYVDEIISIGDYVLTCGEIPAMIITDSVTRLIKGVLPKDATTDESHYIKNVLEAPQYTRPPLYKKLKVPDVLLSGNHKFISNWRKEQSEKRSKKVV
jgi:tRNA (guanine37-N1)-methyltransferase